MKSIIYIILMLNLNVNFVNDIRFEELLRKHISVSEEIIGNDFENKLFQKSFYYPPDEFSDNYFFGMRYHNLTILTNENDMVESISVLFREVIDRQFYSFFIKQYGEPDNIQVIENKQLVSKSTSKDDKGNIIQNLKKSTFDLREGTFEEKPLFIIWKKKDYQIRAFLRHKQNISEITFSLY